MKLSDFKYSVPEHLIAQYPPEKRDHARMMVLHRADKKIEQKMFYHLVDYLTEDDCLVINETKVFPARLIAHKDKTDAEVEVFLLRELESNLWEVLVKPARKVRIGNRLSIGKDLYCDVIDNTVSGGRVVRFNFNGNFFDIIDELGRTPLPPYIKRAANAEDKKNYQTVYAKVRGAVAAPTAGLHFTQEILDQIKAKGTRVVPMVVHVGLGSFRPVQVEELSRHKMDSEYFEIYEETARVINETKERGGRVLAVGTSTVRGLESAVASDHAIKAVSGWTDKFIYPPYDFKVVDGMVTNFHLPGSTLIMLVSAFAGKDFVFKAYRKAIREKYRFYSYGDAMFIV